MKNFVFIILEAVVVFWNLENFFMPRSPQARPDWNESKFYAKCAAISKTVFEIADSSRRMPDVMCFAEVGTDTVLWRLNNGTLLRKNAYRIVHCESPDRRGIDCALMYNSRTMFKLSSGVRSLRDNEGKIIPTRDILFCCFRESTGDSLAVLVNHHPSKLGNGSSEKRETAMRTMLELCDSLREAGYKRIISVGDFNDSRYFPTGRGTIKFNGKWEKIDGCFHFGIDSLEEKVFFSRNLLTEDRKHSGLKPLRTYDGPVYRGGVSDHLPIILTIFEQTDK